ncbi:MAG: hypothetical protein MJB14_09625 [Spirochaetes bacterium]|nr:hypothetical protein [Spirochaetota bacterium]
MNDALNHYAYVGGNPITYSDPTGLWRTREERQAAREARRDARRERREQRRSDRRDKRDRNRAKRKKNREEREKNFKEGCGLYTDEQIIDQWYSGRRGTLPSDLSWIANGNTGQSGTYIPSLGTYASGSPSGKPDIMGVTNPFQSSGLNNSSEETPWFHVGQFPTDMMGGTGSNSLDNLEEITLPKYIDPKGTTKISMDGCIYDPNGFTIREVPNSRIVIRGPNYGNLVDVIAYKPHKITDTLIDCGYLLIHVDHCYDRTGKYIISRPLLEFLAAIPHQGISSHD